jgi:hypothetical protein
VPHDWGHWPTTLLKSQTAETGRRLFTATDRRHRRIEIIAGSGNLLALRKAPISAFVKSP